jgi:hypothetical protein
VKKHKPIRVQKSDFPTEAFKLAELVNQYRRDSGLNLLVTSPSLMFLATAHANDLQFALTSNCGVYSWSDGAGLWKECCSNFANSCFDTKAEELTPYPGVAVELAFATNYTLRSETINLVLTAWTSSLPHNDVILNKGIWSDVAWKSIGVGVNSAGYATLWFGALSDTITFAPESPVRDSTNPPAWYNPTQNWQPTKSYWNPSTWMPTQKWYPTQYWYPTQPEETPTSSHSKLWRHFRNHVYEFWLIALSALVLALLVSNFFLFRTIRKLRQELRITLLTTQGTSCAIPDKC